MFLAHSPKLRMLTVFCTIPFAFARGAFYPPRLKSSFLKLNSSSKLLSHIIVTFKPFPPAAFCDLYKLRPSERRVFLRYTEVNGWLVAHVWCIDFLRTTNGACQIVYFYLWPWVFIAGCFSPEWQTGLFKLLSVCWAAKSWPRQFGPGLDGSPSRQF